MVSFVAVRLRWVSAMSIAVLSVAVALAAPEAACSLNGAMDEGECLCLPGWSGADCGVLDLRPAPPISGMHLPGTASWGASPLVVNQRPYHHRTSAATAASAAGNWSSLSVVLFASTFANQCPLTSWLTNSRVQMTLPGSPVGPFSIQQAVSSTSAKGEVKTTPRRRARPSPRPGVQSGTDEGTILLPTFHHNPSVVRLDDGTVVVYFIGNTNNGTFVKDCAPAPPSGSGTSRAENTPASRPGHHRGEKERRRPAQRHVDVGGVTMVSTFNDHCGEVEMLLCEAIASQCVRAAWTRDNGATWSTSRCPVIAGRALRWDALVSNPSAVEVLVDAATGAPISNGAKRGSNDFSPPTPFKGGRNKSSNVTSRVYLAYRGHDLGKRELIGLAVSPMEPEGNTGRPSFLGPFERVVDTPLTNVRAEDPFLWVDKHMNMHMLTHAFGYPGQNSPYGLHFFAPPRSSSIQANGTSTFYTKWAASASPVYTPHVRYSNGTNATYERVERPQLLLDPATRTVPLVLYNGATFPDTGSWSFTLARPTSSFLAQ